MRMERGEYIETMREYKYLHKRKLHVRKSGITGI